MKKTNKQTSKWLEEFLKRVVITKEESGGIGSATEELFKMRYGKDWKKYYPVIPPK